MEKKVVLEIIGQAWLVFQTSETHPKSRQRIIRIMQDSFTELSEQLKKHITFSIACRMVLLETHIGRVKDLDAALFRLKNDLGRVRDASRTLGKTQEIITRDYLLSFTRELGFPHISVEKPNLV